MSLEGNKALVRRAYEVGLNQRDLSVVDEVFSPEYVSYFPGLPPTKGLDDFKEVLNVFLTAFPDDLVFTIEDQLAEGNKVATRWSARGTHTGVWYGIPPTLHIPPTGNVVTFAATDIYRIIDGKILEEWNTLDQLDLLRQIDVHPAPKK